MSEMNEVQLVWEKHLVSLDEGIQLPDYKLNGIEYKNYTALFYGGKMWHKNCFSVQGFKLP